MAGVAADVVGADFDSAFADRRGPQKIDGEPPEMGEAVLHGSALDRPADQRRRRAGVLMFWIPRADGERLALMPLAEFDISSVQARLAASSPCS